MAEAEPADIDIPVESAEDGGLEVPTSPASEVESPVASAVESPVVAPAAEPDAAENPPVAAENLPEELDASDLV